MGRRIVERARGTAWTDIDLDAEGRHAGYLMIPHSPHEDAWGATRIPIAVIANGSGPTVIVEGGNHGDEYEGPLVIAELIRGLDPALVQGRLILLPAVNAPAAEAGRRTSPVDGLNFNRVFPGNPRGTMTEQIAAFLADELFPRADAFIDLHSGGSSLDILPSAAVEPAADPEHYRRNIAAARAFGAPVTTVISNLGDPRTATAAAVAAGLVAMGTEMGGGGRVSPGALALCRQGLGRVLAHLGVLEAPEGPPPAPGLLLELPGTRAFVHATADGVFEPVGAPGDPVHAGEPAGRIHFPLDPLREPETLLWQADGILYGLRQPGRVRPGNCCAVVAAPFAGAL